MLQRMTIEYDYMTNSFNRDASQQKFQRLLLNGYQIWHLTITWREYKNELQSPTILKERFKHWWLKNFIPHIYQRTNFNTKTRLEQPHCVAYVEFGKETSIEEVKKLYNPITDEFRRSKVFNNLHHHVIIASKGEATKKLNKLIGVNTLREKIINDTKFGNRRPFDNMTQHIKETCLVKISNLEDQLRYPSKNLWIMNIGSVFEFTPTPQPPKKRMMFRPNSKSNEVVEANYKLYVSYQKQSTDTKHINRRRMFSESPLTSE
jgi:hypothetical protein